MSPRKRPAGLLCLGVLLGTALGVRAQPVVAPWAQTPQVEFGRAALVAAAKWQDDVAVAWDPGALEYAVASRIQRSGMTGTDYVEAAIEGSASLGIARSMGLRVFIEQLRDAFPPASRGYAAADRVLQRTNLIACDREAVRALEAGLLQLLEIPFLWSPETPADQDPGSHWVGERGPGAREWVPQDQDGGGGDIMGMGDSRPSPPTWP